MGNIENILYQILDNQKDMKEDISEIKTAMSNVKTTLNAVVNQTADLTEFKAQTKKDLSEIKYTLKFVLKKQIENESEIFKLKQASIK
ncbi:hypothetical protein [Abyssisolibacter fermentans]|uniref:hypothetical protein n=1 Tax=Abyssisolibacter fermentans TaxID=1766203 RepID=UPI00083188E8|nr:hypothetical protein [Abyssisolibacter fermentans]